MSVENWRPVPEWEGVYEVSDHGRVRRILRSSGTRTGVMRGHFDSHGYPAVTLSRPDRKSRNIKIHVLVALAFIGPRPEGMEIRHLDGDPANSHVSNLAYGTHAENMRDMVRHGRTNRDRNTHCPSGHPYDETNTWVDGRNARNCRKCLTARAVKWQQRKRDEANRRGENYFYNVRQWGRQNGWKVAPTGGIAHALLRAYDEAHRARRAA